MSNENERTESTEAGLQIAQEREIQDEIAQTMMLIGPREPLEDFAKEYTDPLYSLKLKDLMSKYSGIRRVRPDGNCFFRGFGFAYFEYLLYHREEYLRFVEVIEASKEKLLGLNYPELTLEDIFDGFCVVLSFLNNGAAAANELHSLFNEQSHSDYIVSYLRFIVSIQLREKEEFYKNFMEEGMTVVEFCQKVVEPMRQESDHIHITALSTALEVGIRVRYMDRSYQGGVNAHDFPESSSQPIVHLLYRPGHYDVLYLRNASTS